MNRAVKNLIKIGLVSNIFEWYEFCVFGYMAGVIGHLFFSGLSPIMSLIKAFFIFSIGYLARPLGGVFFGYLGDLRGRKTSLKLSLAMMATPTIALGFLPATSQYAGLSFILLIVLRIFQGVAAGGELPLSACYAYEKASPQLKPIMCSIVNISSLLGVILGSFVTFVISSVFNYQQLLNGAWRIPFLLSIPMTVYILFVRRNISETMNDSFKNIKDYTQSIKISWRRILKGVILVGFLQVSFYILFIWMPSYLHYFLKKPLASVHYINTLALVAMVPSALLFGYLMRNRSYKKIAGFSIIATSLLSLIIFYGSSRYSLSVLFFLEIMAAVSLAGLDAAIFYILGELFDDKVRSFAMTFSFTLSAAIFGGTSPFLCSYLINKTKINLIPGLYITIFAILAMAILFFLRERLSFDSIKYRAVNFFRLKKI